MRCFVTIANEKRVLKDARTTARVIQTALICPYGPLDLSSTPKRGVKWRERNRVYRLRLGVGHIWHEGHGQPSHRRHLQQHSLHHVWVCVRPAARIDPAPYTLATERLAIDGTVEATRCNDGGSAYCFGANHR